TNAQHKVLPANIDWCSLAANNCSHHLVSKGEGTIEISQKLPLPFTILLSNNKFQTNYGFLLSANEKKAVIYRIKDSVKNMIDETDIEEHLVQSHGGDEQKFWFSVDSQNLFVKYGKGEMRDKRTILKLKISRNEQNLMKEIDYVHVEFVHTKNVPYDNDKIRVRIHKNPVISDPFFFKSNTTIDIQ
ncbi:unnamed protein product, partial [Didymodactylos carnosus]